MLQNKTHFIFIYFLLLCFFPSFRLLGYDLGTFLGGIVGEGCLVGFFFAMNAKLYELCAKIQFYLNELSSLICTEFLNCFSYSLKYSKQELKYPFVI